LHRQLVPAELRPLFLGLDELTQAITPRSTSIPVKLSISLGDGNAKVGRAKIIQTAQKMGIKTPLTDITVIADRRRRSERARTHRRLCDLPQSRQAVAPHTIVEVRSGTGEVIWRFDRDGKKPSRSSVPQVARDMIFMMNKVVEEGTARRAQLDGIKAAGKTGTTNALSRRVVHGSTGQFRLLASGTAMTTTPTNRMTGGALPAMTGEDHDLTRIRALRSNPCPDWAVRRRPWRRSPPPIQRSDAASPRPTMLTRRSIEVLLRVEHMMDNATRALADTPLPKQRRTARERARGWRGRLG